MKNQLFGDNRDLLKFDLVCQIAQTNLVDRFTYIPMLTADEPQKEEPHFCRHEATGGGENQELVQFLDNCIVNEKRNIGQLEQFFQGCHIQAVIYDKENIFTQETREAYFNGISKPLLTRALVLIDPDKGLEERQNGSGNLLYSELKNLYERMDNESILMLTQRFPYDLYEAYLEKRVAEIKDQIRDAQPISLDDLDSIIFFLTKSRITQVRLLQLLGEYTRKYTRKAESP